jgi:hypothetical protein
MEKPTCDEQTAMNQAGMTIDGYFATALDLIEESFGPDFASRHPELIGQIVSAQAADFHTTAISAAIYTAAQAVDRLARAVCPFEIMTGTDAAGGTVGCLTEATMGQTAGLVHIADSLANIHAAMVQIHLEK